MADTALPVIEAIIATLKAKASITSLAGSRIYTDVPQEASFPYIVVSIQSEPFAANDFSGQSHAVRVQAFSRSASIQECLTLRGLVVDALDRREESIALGTGTLVKCE